MIRAIYWSRFFLPVYSRDYFVRDYCRHELQHAMTRNVKREGFILPVARGVPNIPEEYSLVQYIDAAEKLDFMDDILKKVWVLDDKALGL